MKQSQPQFTPEEQSQHDNENIEIDKLVKAGHSQHCACRQVWGDGECECSMYKEGYNPYAWMGKKMQDGEPNFENAEGTPKAPENAPFSEAKNDSSD